MVYRRYRRRSRTNRRTGSRQRRYRGRLARRASSRKTYNPEIKHLDYTATVDQSGGGAGWSYTNISPTIITQGVGVSQMIGQQIQTRFMVVQMELLGANSTDTNKTYQDGDLRMVFFICKQDYTAISTTYIPGLAKDINTFLDYDIITVLKDIKVNLGNQTGSNGSRYMRHIRLVMPWPRTAKLRPVGSAFQFDEQRDVLYCMFFTPLNDAHIRWNSRITFMDC